MFFDLPRRIRQAKGHGIHSPFAFHFITGVIYEKYGYNAFSDMEKILSEHRMVTSDQKLHHLSYRLVRYFRPEKVLEIGSGKGINTLYIGAADKNLACFCFDSNKENRDIAGSLLRNSGRNIQFPDKIDDTDTYGGIFVYFHALPVSIENLLSMSTDDTFWVITGIKSGCGKHFWKKIVSDERIKLTFDMKDRGIVVLKKSYHKANYLI